MLTVGNDAGRVERMLEEGSLCCPVCGGRLAGWGHALERVVFGPVGFHNSATGVDLGFYAARSYSLMRPPRTGRRLIRSW